MDWEKFPDLVAVTVDKFGRQKGHKTPPIFNTVSGVWVGIDPKGDVDFGLSHETQRCEIRPDKVDEVTKAQQEKTARPGPTMGYTSNVIPGQQAVQGVHPSIAAYDAAGPTRL